MADDAPDFCSELNRRSKAIHDKSDKAVRIKLAVALTDVEIYGRVLADFYHVFKAIEELISENDHVNTVSAVWSYQLGRSSNIEQDLLFYMGTQWKDVTKPSIPAQQYVSHLRKTCGENPDILIAYVHTMYLALLAGGHILKKVIRKTLGLTTENGLMVFTFTEGSRIELKKHIKNAINSMNLCDDLKEKIVQEKIRIFEMNNDIIAHVQPNLKSYERLVKLILILLSAVGAMMCLLYRLIYYV